MSKFIANSIMMIKPSNFNYNEQTSINNHYQKNHKIYDLTEIQKNVAVEFNDFVNKLKKNNIDVNIFNDNNSLFTPDSIFPNNWISFHENKTIILYPMFAKNRRLERRVDIIEKLRVKYNVEKFNLIDLSVYEKDYKYLEGTGSMILDRHNKIIYSSLSERTNKTLLDKVSSILDYELLVFKSFQTVKEKKFPIYHTNVMMSLGDTFAIICDSLIINSKERNSVMNSLRNSGKEIILLNENQINSFAGNMILLKNKKNANFLIMSNSAYNSLSSHQIDNIQSHVKIIKSNLSTIEYYGGGGARCMITELFF
ncbi:MAG: amidinotransferase [Flavobacteriales bacterium]|nr:amidinotransferase [Flavobacteriales bacterium]|tara:strand:- start:3376 stop:4308 length:933 start_codon:yes stop_codon:yes gene_type:complete